MGCCKDKKQSCLQGAKIEADYLVCTCMGVMYLEICESIKNGSNTFEALSDALGVGSGCSSCVAEVHAILDQQNKPRCCKS